MANGNADEMASSDATLTDGGRLSDRFIGQKAMLEVESMDRKYCADHIKVLTRLWIVMQLCTLAVVISGFAVAVTGGDAGYGFLGIYIAILSIFMTVVGAMILRKYRTPAHHGLLVGLGFMMSNIMLINAVLVGTRRNCAAGTNAAEMAMGAFSVFLFFIYGVFTALVYFWKEDIVVHDTDLDMGGIEMGDDELEGVSGARGRQEEERADLKMV